MPRRLLALTLALAGILAVPATAVAGSAATFDQGPGRDERLRYVGAAGEVNSLTVERDGATLVVADPAGVVPGRGCVAIDATHVRCAPSPGRELDGANVRLGNGNDTATIVGTLRARLHGDDGNDTLNAGAFGSLLVGGRGNDVMNGGPAPDTFDQGNAPDGSDRMIGGGDLDTARYVLRRTRVAIDRQGDRDDGARGELDRIGNDVEELIGGRAADRVTGSIFADRLFGGGGSDVLRGGRGGDLLVAEGTLPFRATGSRDQLDGGPNDDVLYGSAGPNRLELGTGLDLAFAGAGNDAIRGRDRAIDELGCHGGRDRVQLDGFDFFSGGCELVSRSQPPAAAPLDLFAAGTRPFVNIGCPGDFGATCVGRVTLRDGARTLGSSTYSLGRGRQGLVRVTIPADFAASAASSARPVTVIVTSRRGRQTMTVTTRMRLGPEGGARDAPSPARR